MIIFAVAWVIAGVINYGAMVADFDQEYPRLRDNPVRSRELATRGMIFASGGLVALPVLFVLTLGFRHGLQYTMEQKT